MAARLQGRKAGTLEARQIVCNHIGEALRALKGSGPSDISIHTARKAIKKARAVWRLLRTDLPAAAYQQINNRLRDAGRPLGAARDAKILLLAIDSLRGSARDAVVASHLRTIRRTLAAQANEIKRAVQSKPAGVALSRRTLRRVRRRIRRYSLAKHGWSTLGKGLSRVYRRGRRLYQKARSGRRVQDLHEWRKQAKYLHHQLTVLKPLCKRRLAKTSAEAAELTDKLGDDHDLAILRTQICAPESGIPPAAQEQLASLIEQERTRLQDAAFILGASIYAEKPGEFSARLGGYWQQWRHSQNA